MSNDKPSEALRSKLQYTANAAVAEKDYEVGFGKPPKATRFIKGQSGNPEGRPKVPSISDVTPIIDKVLAEPAQIREAERIRTVSKLEAALRAQVKHALLGNTRAVRAVFTQAEMAGLLRKAQQKGFLEQIEPRGEQGEIIRVYHERSEKPPTPNWRRRN